jgi:hypothetical protein
MQPGESGVHDPKVTSDQTTSDQTTIEDDQACPGDDEGPDLNRRSRRRLLGLAGAAAAAGVTAAGLPEPRRAAAANGDPIAIGGTVTGTGFTRADHTGAAAGAAFLFQAGSTFTSTDGRHKAALNGWTSTTAIPAGVYGWSDRPDGAGVVGRAIGADSAGVLAEHDGPSGSGLAASGSTAVTATGVTRGVVAVSSATQGTAVHAESTGFSSAAVRAIGSTNDGFGVLAFGQVGVRASGTQMGVYTEDCPTGVYGTGTEVGLAGYGPVAPLWLTPLGVAAPDSGVAHQPGQFQVDESGDMWYCVASGTPGTFRKLAGAATAGAFHALTATRVYDSRSPQPRRGRMASGSNRLVSVAAGRHLATGAVSVVDLVPPRATAVTLSVSVLATAGQGTLTVNPGGVTTVTGTTVSWWGRGQSHTAATVVPLDTARRITLCLRGPRAKAHVTVDVTGYHL